MSPVRVVPFDSPLVSIEPFNATARSTFAAVLERLQSAIRFQTSSAYAVVTNHSESAIEVLVMRWSMEEDGTARRKASNVIHEGFSNPPYQPVLAPGARRLATDAGLLPESLPERFVVSGGEWLGIYQTVEIDSAIFEDGRIAGPDRYGVVKHVRERRSAVKELLSLMDEGLASGRTIDDIISDFKVASDETRTRVWREMLISNVRRNHSLLDYLRRQRELPANFPR
jgi:hypothetical protein